MRKSDITPEIIELARKISEYWRMEIYEGCWVMYKNKISKNSTQKLFIAVEDISKRKQNVFAIREIGTPYTYGIKVNELLPIPTIFDAMEEIYNRSCPFGTFTTLKKRFNDWTHGVITTQEFYEDVLTALLQALESREGK